jgi:hypothetical protein
MSCANISAENKWFYVPDEPVLLQIVRPSLVPRVKRPQTEGISAFNGLQSHSENGMK